MAYVTINDKRNVDWGMDFLGKVIAPAAPKNKTVDIPYRDGSIVIESSGGIKYSNRQISIRCEIRKPRIEWPHLQMELANEYHGKLVKVSFDDDPDHFWCGRCSVGQITDNKATATIIFTINAEPFRRCTEPLLEETVSIASGQSESFTFDNTSPRAYITLKGITTNETITVNATEYAAGYNFTNEMAGILVVGNPGFTLQNNSNNTRTYTVKVFGGDL